MVYAAVVALVRTVVVIRVFVVVAARFAVVAVRQVSFLVLVCQVEAV